MTLEEWRPVAGFEQWYQVSSEGRVRSLDRTTRAAHGDRRVKGRVRKLILAPNGYYGLRLSAQGVVKTVFVHQLVAQVFVEGEAPGLVVCHKNGRSTDNRAANLRWGTPSSNVRDSVNHGTHGMTRKTHCPQGHEYTEQNTRRWRSSRICRTCTNGGR